MQMSESRRYPSVFRMKNYGKQVKVFRFVLSQTMAIQVKDRTKNRVNTTIARCLVGAVAVGCLFLTNEAGAAMLIYATSTPVPSTPTDWTSSLVLQQFNPSLGTLDSVTIELETTLNSTLTVANTAATSSSGKFSVDMSITPADPLLADSYLDVSSPSQSYTLGGGDSETLPPVSVSGNSLYTYTDNPTLSEFTGTGDYLLDISTYTETDLSYHGGNTDASQVTTASATAFVTYDYSTLAIPEPAAYASVAGIAAVGFLGLRIRRNH